MSSLNLLKNRVNEIKASSALQNSFTSTSIQDGNKKRVYNILNTNIKTINTYSKYLSDIYDDPTGDHHQSYAILRQLRVYFDSRDNLSSTQKDEISVRRDILLRIYREFPKRSSFVRTFLTFILALKSGFNLFDGTQYLLDSIPTDLITNYDNYLKEVLNDTSVSVSNPVFGIYVLYSDPDLLDCYLDLYTEDPANFEKNTSFLDSISFINKRIENCQKSGLRTECLLFSLYLMISGLKIENLSYDDIVDILVSSLEEKLNNLDLEQVKLFDYKPDDLKTLNDILLDFNEKEKEEILSCLGNDSQTGTISVFKKGASIPIIPVEESNGKGYDADTHTKSRRGQQRFKRALFDSLGNSKIKCAICGCEANGKDFLVASHILPWYKASAEQKVDPNNGLLLCPNHDFLFDSLLISFDEKGLIMISDDLSEENKRGFRVNEHTHIDLTPEKEVYMKMHREAFLAKGWKK